MSAPKKRSGPHSRMARYAKLWFKYQGLDGAPQLPLLPQDRYWLMNMQEGPLGYITACYAISVESHGYDVYSHPDAHTYACGLIACCTLPSDVREDPEMQRRFPACKLEGLDEATLCWRPCSTEAA